MGLVSPHISLQNVRPPQEKAIHMSRPTSFCLHLRLYGTYVYEQLSDGFVDPRSNICVHFESPLVFRTYRAYIACEYERLKSNA